MASKRSLKFSVPRGATPFGRVLEHLAWLISGKGVGAVLSLFYLAIVTRTLGPADFGRFILIVSAATAINSFVGFNVWQVIVKYGQPYLPDRDSIGLGRLIAFCGMIDLGAGMVGCAISYVLAFGFGDMLGIPPELAWQAFGFAAVITLTLRSTPVGVLRLFNRFNAAAISETTVPITRMIGSLIVLWIKPTIFGFLLVWAAAELISAGLYWIYTLRTLRTEMGPLGTRKFWRVGKETPGMSSFLMIANLNFTLSMVSAQAPVLLVGAFAGPVGAGLFRLAYQLSQSMTKLSILFSRSVYSELAHVHAHYGRKELSKLFRKLSLITLAAAFASALLVLLAGKPILLAMSGPAYAGAYPMLLILGIASAVSLAGVSMEPLMLATNGASQSMVLKIITTVLLIGALLIVLPLHGPVGGAYAILAVSILSLVLMAVVSYRHLRRA